MSQTQKILAIIPARSGSKGLRHKNIQLLGGKPLMAWSIEAAKESKYVHRVIVSTDSGAFAEIAKEYGADAPFLRPAKFSGDNAKVEDALLHTLNWLESHEKEHYDIVLLLQTTDVFRNLNIVDQVIESLLVDQTLDTVFAAKPDFKNYWKFDKNRYERMNYNCYIPRQKRHPIYREDTGVALATRVRVIKEGNRVGASVSVIPHENNADFIDIHTEFDMWLANKLVLEKNLVPNRL